MAHVAAKVTLPYVSGLPSDVSVQTFHFDGDPGDSAELSQLSTYLENFYNVAEGTNRVAYYLSGQLVRTSDACTIEWYDMTQAEPRVPIAGRTWTLLAAGAAGSLPNEVAVCGSYRAEYASGSPPARRRGRLFLGPLSSVASLASSNVAARVVPSMTTDVGLSMRQLAIDSTTEGAPWSVWSRVDDVVRPIIAGWVDNDFDTMRSRQVEASTRIAWTTSV